MRHGSVTRAAGELNVTDGAVSRAVRELEADFGFDLFHRGNRQIVPTPAARTLAGEVRSALDALSATLARTKRSGAPDHPLVLSCEPTFLIRWLIPRLPDLQQAVGSSRELRFVSAGGNVPFAREGIDLAIRRADFPLPDDIRVEPFLRERVGPVCRPDLAASLAGAGPVEGTLLHTRTRLGAWTTWSDLTGTELRPRRELHFEHFYLSLQAAVAGAGIAIGPIALVADDLAAGVLCAPRGFAEDGSNYVLMAPRSCSDAGIFDLVLGWLGDQTGLIASSYGSGHAFQVSR